MPEGEDGVVDNHKPPAVKRHRAMKDTAGVPDAETVKMAQSTAPVKTSKTGSEAQSISDALDMIHLILGLPMPEGRYESLVQVYGRLVTDLKEGYERNRKSEEDYYSCHFSFLLA